ncbi:hypothetical protein GTP45_27035 [Pseudoduganella sp. FT55W]|uniref:Uncharacterized protein n=1 Tax=Duganella rivi TaxID=2666083 RepID=A0A7X4KEM8_9BURK|nr:hypothetical protein [Duganella rivi]MYM70435.1 hypothetical protein [Duganella rivi]
MKRTILCLSFLINLSTVFAHECPSKPCGNTATGEDPQRLRAREGAAGTDAIRAGADDQQRWSSIRLNSDSTKPERLKLVVVKSAGFEMRLDPQLGQLTFGTPVVRHTFAIASPRGDRTSVCPEYSLQIVEASAAHALARMVCLQAEYAPARYHMGVDYYLYDVDTGVMRNIWRAAVSDKNGRMPDANPKPSLQVIPNGYQLDWSGAPQGRGKDSTTTLHNRFTRTSAKNGQQTLLCTNLSVPKGQGVEDEMCEGGILPRVVNK